MRKHKRIRNYTKQIAKEQGFSERLVNDVLMQAFRRMRFILQAGHDYTQKGMFRMYTDKRITIRKGKNKDHENNKF